MTTVTIFRTKSFLEKSQTGAPGFLARTKQSIGGYWASASSKAMGTGLTPTEQNILLPLILDISSTDREFRKEMREFYMGLTTKVDYTNGTILNISLHDNEKPLSEKNLPVEPMDYIRYKHALGHPEVADSLAASEGNALIKFYVHNPATVKDLKADLRKKKDEAMKAYLGITADETKVDNVLALLGEDPRGFKDLSEKLNFLQAKSMSGNVEELTTLIDTIADKQLETKGFIKKLVATGILKLVGTRHMMTETSAIIGNDLEETVLELQDEEKNSELLVVLKAKLQDQMKKKVARLNK